MNKITKCVLIVAALTAGTVANAQWNAPDHNSPLCVATPAELAQKPEIFGMVQTIVDQQNKTGLDAIRGTWKFSNIFARATISFDYDETGFYVQSEDDLPEKVSVCGDDQMGFIRVAVHEPGCPENRNLYIKTAGINRFTLKAYSTRAVGSVKFKKLSDEPQPKGSPKPKVKCKMESY